MIKAIIFDFGGVFRNEASRVLFSEIENKFQINREQLFKGFKGVFEPYERGKISDQEAWQKFSQNIGKNLPAGYEALWTDKYISGERIDEKMLALVPVLKQRGFRVALLSNTLPPHAQYNKDQKRYDLFDEVVLSSDVGMAKPDKEIYHFMLNKLGMAADECIFVDDKPANVKTANEIGMKGIIFLSYEDLLEKFKEFEIEI